MNLNTIATAGDSYHNHKKPRGYYENWENVKREVKKIIEDYKEKFPTSKELLEAGHTNLADSILKYHGGVNAVKERMGYEINRISEGDYQNWDNFERDMKKAIKDNNGEFPSRKTLTKMRKSSLSTAITKYHGGFAAARKKLEENNIIFLF